MERERAEVRERLGEEALGNLLAAFGNHEAKAITLGLMQPNTIYTSGDLSRLVNAAQGQRPGWKQYGSVPFKYCLSSLSPIGLVTQEVTTRGGHEVIGYMKTAYGQQTGNALAGLLLDFSLQHPDYSLQDLFGQTASVAQPIQVEEIVFKTRAPLTRLRIFLALLTSPSLPIREVDLLEQLEYPRNQASFMQNHLQELYGNRVISYESARREEPYVFYQLLATHLQQDPEPYRTFQSLSKFVWETIRDNPDQEWTAEAFAQQYAAVHQRPLNKYLTNTVSGILSSFTNQGYMRRIEGFDRLRQSEILVTIDQGGCWLICLMLLIASKIKVRKRLLSAEED